MMESGMTKKPIIELKNISKSFPGVKALDRIHMVINNNEILGLVGENGAGKSTLMKILVGLHEPDEGVLIHSGKQLELKDPDMAIRNGIGMVFQEGNLIPNLTILENLFLCHEDNFTRYGFISQKKMYSEAVKILERVKVKLDPQRVVRELRAADKQMIEIARLLWLSEFYNQENPLLILDEPTTVLIEEEVETLFAILQEIKRSASIIFISHRLEEVIQNTERLVILKDGQLVSEMSTSDADTEKVERLMVGHGFTDDRYLETDQTEIDDTVLLEVHDLTLEDKFEPISFTVRKGEIISLVGLLGSGKEEVCQCLAGIIPADGGTISVQGKRAHIRSPKDAITAGIGYLPVDRRTDGLALDMDVEENINLLVLPELRKGPLLSSGLENENARRWVEQNNIKTPSFHTKTANLSGGNQQKVVLAKWLSSHVRVLIVDHPTRGIDVGAKEEIYRKLRALSRDGMGIIIMCDTLEEDIGLAHRLVIMKDGKFVEEVPCPKEDKPEPLNIIGSIV